MLQLHYNEKLLSNALKQAIKDSKHTAASLSRETGISPTNIRDLCNENKPFNPTLKTLYILSKSLQTDLLEVILNELGE